MLDEVQIEALEQRRCAAMIAADADALGQLFDESLIWVHGSTRKDTKQSFLAGLTGSGPKYRSIDRSDIVIRCFGDCAVVNGVQTMQCIIQGEERALVNHFVNVWSAHDGTPRIVAWQSTPAPAH